MICSEGDQIGSRHAKSDTVMDSTLGDTSGETQQAGELFPVVAIGASAGGLEAFNSLLRQLPADTGMAFIFIQHLAPAHESLLPHLLSRETSMPVNQIENGALLSPNQVYVIPPNAAIAVSRLTLAVTPRATAGTAIDGFLRSLAVSHKSKALAVILSGTGSDGTLGVQAIAEEGGVIFVQEPESAQFDGMPRSAIATGCSDFILPPERIGTELARISREPRLIEPDLPELALQNADTEREFQAVADLLKTGTGIDFNLYRQTTVRRRMLRRLAVLKLQRLRDYVEYLRENPDEAHALGQDILIRVTRFFRDPDAFEILSRKVLPALIRKTPPDRVARVWVAGCSTGEEAYSIAMCFVEVAEQMQSRVPIQVFATDINEAAIDKARRGTYPDNIAADVSPERLSRFFVREGRDFQIGRGLRDLCIFSRHDLLNDPPFSRMTLVSCRNVLIYLDSMQQQALSRFHFALDPGGFLLLGKSETATSFPGLFTPLDKGARIYVKQESARHFVPERDAGARAQRASALANPPSAPQPKAELCRLADRVMAARYGHPRVVIDLNLEAVAYGGETVPFAPNIRNEKLLDAAKNAQPLVLKNAVRTAVRTGQSVSIEPVTLDGVFSAPIGIKVTPLGPERLHCLVVFEQGEAQREEDPRPGRAATKEDARQADVRIGRLEKELAASRAHLEAVISDQEAANEELLATNEELQSLNEEIQSSKEELEAANEELATMNVSVRGNHLFQGRI
jgi:two-component system, chemotaxis family, CheB/CheR fusion protein